jgi:hypothetical protein
MFQLLTHEKSQLTQRFFEEVAVQVRKTSSMPTATPSHG